MSTNNAIMIIDPAKSIEDARNRRSIVVTLREKNILRAGTDYGIVPGSAKPTLLKPGAERLCAAFGFNPQFEILDKIERWEPDNPLFFYQVVCHLIHIDSGLEVATGVGSCNSLESKYRWRWVDANDVPSHLDKNALVSRGGTISEFDFAIEKAETGGKYGKPHAYWQAFKDAIASGTARKTKRKTNAGKELDAWEIGGLSYRIPNDDVFSLVNTVVKMACKRSLVAAALIGANASEFFTQDIEDMPGFGVPDADTEIVEGTFTEFEPAASTSQPSASVKGAGVRNFAAPAQPGNSATGYKDPFMDDMKRDFHRDDEEDKAMLQQHPKAPDGDADAYTIDKLIVNVTDGALQYLLSVHKSATRIYVTDPTVLEKADVDGKPVLTLAAETRTYRLTPMWTAHAHLDADGWQISSVETRIPLADGAAP